MPSPFPGMDPYLENPEFWREVHNRLIVAIADALAPLLRPKYRVAIDKRTYLSDGEEESLSVAIPDVAVISQKSTASQSSSTLTLPAQSEAVTVIIPMPEDIGESYIEIKEVETGNVVTAIEILSPTNKRAGVGRNKYENKRMRVLSSPTHLIEIDLLRGKPMRIISEIPKTDYRILVSRENRRPRAQLYAFSVRQPIPAFQLPLRSRDTEPVVDLQSLLVGVYDRAGFDMAIDYNNEPVPPLKEEDRVWADALLRERGVRG